MLRATVFTFVSLLFVACGHGAEGPTPDGTTVDAIEQSIRSEERSLYALQVFDRRTRKGQGASSFAIDAVDELYFALDVPDVPGRHTATLVVYSDGDMPYASYDLEFAVQLPPREGEKRAVRVHPPQSRVWFVMPVAGTWIQQFQLTGNWRVEVFIDGGVVGPISTHFELY